MFLTPLSLALFLPLSGSLSLSLASRICLSLARCAATLYHTPTVVVLPPVLHSIYVESYQLPWKANDMTPPPS